MLGCSSTTDSGSGAAAVRDHLAGGQLLKLVDSNRGGKSDCVDLNSDATCDVGLGAVCLDPLIDADGDGVSGSIETNCDGAIDISWCAKPLLDSDRDGRADGLDFDCDGTIDDKM